MKYRFAIATALNWLIVAVLFGIGVDYVASTKLKPHHEQILDVAWSDLTPRCQMLMSTLMKGTGLVAVTAAVSLAILLAVPFRRREPWSRWAILLVAWTALGPTLIGAVRLRIETGASSPWWPHVVLLAMLSAGFWLTRDFKRPGRAVKFPNWQSRLLLWRAARQQRTDTARLPRPLEAFLQWYERGVLKVDVSRINVDRPVFLIGMPRSGTTMLQDILCAHPGLAYVNNAMNRFPAAFCAIEHFRRRLRLDFEGERYIGDSVLVSASSPNDAQNFWGDWFKQEPFSLEYRKLAADEFPAEEVHRIKDTIRKVIWCQGDPSKRFFCKLLAPMPYLDLVRDIFPDAKYVHIIRDARMTANSMVKLCQREIERQKMVNLYCRDPQHGDQFFIPYPRFPRLAEYVKRYGAEDVRTTARLWNDAIFYVDEIKDTLACFHQVRFEDILANPQQEVGRILEFCELPPVGEDNTAFWSKIREVGAVQHVNQYECLDLIEDLCRDNLRKHGYLDGDE